MQMMSTQTFDVPGAAAAIDGQPLAIAQGTRVPVRVLVRNIGPTVLFLAGSSQDVVSPEGPSSKTYQLPPGLADVFVVSPGQKLFAIGATPGGRACVAISEALPLV